MSYDPDKIFALAEKAIIDNNLYFVNDILAYIPCNQDTFYRMFPKDSEKNEYLKSLLNKNKVNTKVGLRKLLYKGRGTDRIALYKLIGDEEERKALSLNYHDLSSTDRTMSPKSPVDLSQLPTDLLEQIVNYFEGLESTQDGGG